MTHELLREKEGIINWLNQYNIKDYELLEDGFYGYVVNVDGNVSLRNKKLTRVAVKFNMIKGYFDCSHNQLITLEGAPKKIGGDFYCEHNQLTTLLGFPKEVGGGFFCSHNQLITLEGAPKKVEGDFSCHNNQLITLKGSPKEVGGGFYCSRNKLTTLEGASKKVEGDFSCLNNQLTTLEGAPKKVGGDFYCRDNHLVSLGLKNFPEIIGGIIDLKNNPLLGHLQEISDINEIKNILMIKEEQELLNSTIESNKMNSNILKL